ncbi:DUF4244 domain-containing protein [Streptomyces sp. NPDC035033]|uniref:DUF4244 domain-containing protein n=1 Tax=Streptomyces sp. NPDC035033 TaxID=3155368 RepID=UPI0033E3B781
MTEMTEMTAMTVRKKKACARARKALRAFWAVRRAALRTDGGMSTVEYALGMLTAAGVAALLYKVMTGGAVSGALESLVTKALDAPF